MLKRHPYSEKRRNYLLPFSLFQVIFRIFIIANFLLSIIIIIDFFLAETTKPFKVEFDLYNNIQIREIKNYKNLKELNISKQNKLFNSGDTVYVSFTPIFDLKKSFYGKANNNGIIKRNDLELALPSITVFSNTIVFFIFIFYSRNLYKMIKEDKHSLYSHMRTIDAFFWAPTLLSLLFWFKLYKCLFN